MLSNFLIDFPSRTQRALPIPLLCFYTKHSHLRKIRDKNTSNFVKPWAIRPQMLSNTVIHSLSRTWRVLSNGHHLSSIRCSRWLQNAKSHCKIPDFRENLSRFARKCFPIFSFYFPSRTQRALSIPLLCFYTKNPHIPKISRYCQKTLEKYIKFCKTRRDSPRNAFQLFHSSIK